MNKIKNIQNIKKIIIKPKVHCYCPLGKDWYDMQLYIKIKVADYYPDYCDIRTFINEKIQGKEMIIEDVLYTVKNFIETYEVKKVTVKGVVDMIDSHPPVEVTI